MSKIYSTVSFVVNKNQITKAFDVILKNSLTYIKYSLIDNEDLKITIYSFHLKEYMAVFEQNKINVKFSDEQGFLSFIRKNKHRLGLFLGFVFLIVAIFVSSKFVWCINVEGNKNLTYEDVINELNEAGFSIGSFVPKINYKELHNKILLTSDDISWISINITGNVANVTVKERLKENEYEKTEYSNIVAKSDGQIALISVIEGEKKISIGDTVKKGELLISGIIDSQSQGVRYVNAKGEVKAYVNKVIDIEIPYEANQKTFINNVYKQKSYKIFNKIIFFSTKYRNYGDFCDTIEKMEQVKLFNKICLPIYITTTYFYEYEYKNTAYTKEQAVDLAFKELREKMDAELQNSELISKNVRTSYDEFGFYIHCELYCLEDIAFNVKFNVKNNGG